MGSVSSVLEAIWELWKVLLRWNVEIYALGEFWLFCMISGELTGFMLRYGCLSRARSVLDRSRVLEWWGDIVLSSRRAVSLPGGHPGRSNFPPFACSFLVFPPTRRLSEAKVSRVSSLTTPRRRRMYKYWRKCEETPQALICQQTQLPFFS